MSFCFAFLTHLLLDGLHDGLDVCLEGGDDHALLAGRVRHQDLHEAAPATSKGILALAYLVFEMRPAFSATCEREASSRSPRLLGIIAVALPSEGTCAALKREL